VGWAWGKGRVSPSAALALLFAVVIGAAYANSFGGGFHFDDSHVLEQNPFIRSLRHVPRFFVDPNTTTVLRENEDLRPLLLLTFALNYAVSGSATWSYHAVNLVLHWSAVLLVFRIVRDHLWLGDDALAVAAASALVVALHPLNTEPVDYLSARSALLTTVFSLAAFDATARARPRWAVVLLAAALLTKAIAATLPLAVAGYALLARHRQTPAPSWQLVAALAVVAAGGLLYRLLLLPPWISQTAHAADVTPRIWLMTGWSAYLYYLRLFLWPDALVVDRLDYPLTRSFLEPRAWGSLLVLLVLGGLAWRARRRWPALTFAALWYAVALAAEQTIFPLTEPVNEHRPYLAMLGLGTAAGLGLRGAAHLLARPLRVPATRVVVVLVALVAIALGVATAARNEVWRDDGALWRDAVAKAPANPRAWLNAGHAAMARDDRDEARRLLLEAHRLAPCYAYVQLNLSALAFRTGDLAQSLRWADEAVACNPGFALTHYYRAMALERLGRAEEALAAYRRTTTIDAEQADAWAAQGRLLERQGAWAEAARAYERAVAANPTLSEPAMLAALLHQYRLRDPSRAVELYRTVLRLVPSHYGAHYQLAVALLACGREPEARAAWRAFVPMAEAIGDRASIEGAPERLRRP